MYDLPMSVEVGGQYYDICTDYRGVLGICAALNDPEMTEDERGNAALGIFYPAFEDMPPAHYNEAVAQLYWFIRCGDEPDSKKSPTLVSWEQDFSYVVAPINRVMGKEIRAVEYLHWWTFIAAYREIGDCLFAQIVNIRKKKADGKKLDKSEQEFYRQNYAIIDIKTTYTDAEDAFFSRWGVK